MTLLSDDRPRGTKGLSYRKVWSFKGSTKAFIAQQLAECSRPVVHVFCGASRLGDVLVDLHHPAAGVKAGAEKKAVKGLKTILADPPWGAALDVRARWMLGLTNALGPGGVLLLYAPWMPASYGLRFEGAWLRNSNRWHFQEAPVMPTKWTRVVSRNSPKVTP